MIILVFAVMGLFLHVADEPVCRNTVTSAYVDSRCGPAELDRQKQLVEFHR